MSKLNIMDHTGHTAIDFKPGDHAEAMAKFNELLKSGHTAAKKVAGGDGQFEVVRAFDPDAEEIIMKPRLVGG